MKKKYQKPTIETSSCVAPRILAASPAIGGNTGITPGGGDEPPSSGDSKQGMWDDARGSARSVWD